MPARRFRPSGLLALLLSGLPWADGVAADQGALRPWNTYHVIMWVGDTVWKHPDKLPLFLDRLREMGVDTAMVSDGGTPQPFVTNHFPYYVENLVNRGLCLKWNSKVADWDRFVTDWAREGRPESAFVRQYCFDDPAWLDWARGEMRAAALANADYAPLAYDIRDELSVTYSANPFDYDFSPPALAEFRHWLKTQYPDLAALNAEWETAFDAWNQVIPFSTDEIKNRLASGEAQPRGQPDWQRLESCRFEPASAGRNRTRWNFAPWCDFRSYMDRSLAQTLNDLREAAQVVDPRTPVGIEGTQMPDAFGGYDLWRLSRVLDWAEVYDIGNARDIFAAFMPGKPILTTVFEKETNPARRRLWHLLLEGDRGCIVWWSEDCIDWSRPDYELTAKARGLAPVLTEMKSPLAQLFLRAQREFDPIALVYSQPSIQVDWLLESTGDGSTWPRRFSSFEGDHNRMVKVRDAWLKAFEDLGYSPRFIPASALTQPDALARVKVLVLPTTRAIAANEVTG
ncbi:MAG TPA: beta-galactosidase, partial [Candidatus Acidoferrales bacterium]|nr:beta-galactosidase [Candidatus Acidoferrales bacterium]